MCLQRLPEQSCPKKSCRENGPVPILKQDCVIPSCFQPPAPTVVGVGRLAACIKYSDEQSKTSDSNESSEWKWSSWNFKSKCWAQHRVGWTVNYHVTQFTSTHSPIKRWARRPRLPPRGVPSLALVYAWPAITAIHVKTQRPTLPDPNSRCHWCKNEPKAPFSAAVIDLLKNSVGARTHTHTHCTLRLAISIISWLH